MVSSHDGSTSARTRATTAWDERPLKRLRFYTWLLVWWIFGFLTSLVLQSTGVPSLTSVLVVVVVAGAHLVLLARAAWQETVQRHASGHLETLVSIWDAVAWVLAAGVSWVATGIVFWAYEVPLMPLVPVAVTVLAVMKLRQRRQQSRRLRNGSGAYT